MKKKTSIRIDCFMTTNWSFNPSSMISKAIKIEVARKNYKQLKPDIPQTLKKSSKNIQCTKNMSLNQVHYVWGKKHF